jgi:hypothetical protein
VKNLILAVIVPVILVALAATPAMAMAEPPPPPKIEAVNFTNNEVVSVDHTKPASPSKLTKKEELPEKAKLIGEFEGEAGEGANSYEWKSKKGTMLVKTWPVAYPQNTVMTINNTRLALEAGATAFLKAQLEGEVTLIGTTTVGGVAIEFEQKLTEAEVKGQIEGVGSHPTYLEFSKAANASAALPKEVGASKMTIKWKWKLKEKGKPAFEQPASESAHNLYLLYGKALKSPIYFTLLAQDAENIAKEGAKPTEAQVIAGVWKDFSNGANAPAGFPIWIYVPAMNTAAKGTEPMWYYQGMTAKNKYKEIRKQEEEAFAYVNSLTTTEELLEYLDGQCGAWREALTKALEAESIASTKVEIRALVEEKGKCEAANQCEMLVRNWNFTKGGGGFPNKENEVEREEGVMGQGVKTPNAGFVNHYVIELGNKLYDPSYGVGPIAGKKGTEGPLGGGEDAKEILKTFQEKAVGGFCRSKEGEMKCQIVTNALELEAKAG